MSFVCIQQKISSPAFYYNIIRILVGLYNHDSFFFPPVLNAELRNRITATDHQAFR